MSAIAASIDRRETEKVRAHLWLSHATSLRSILNQTKPCRKTRATQGTAGTRSYLIVLKFWEPTVVEK